MFQLVTGGNSIQKLTSIIKYLDIVSVYSITNNNILILPLPMSSSVDRHNNIITPYSRVCNKSSYIYKFIVNSFINLWARIIFKGKGFRIRNFQTDLKLTFNFGYSHWTKLKLYKKWFFWKIRRQSYMIVTADYSSLKIFNNTLPKIKLMNKYTQRGLRLKKQCIVRRFGKISQYISSLH